VYFSFTIAKIAKPVFNGSENPTDDIFDKKIQLTTYFKHKSWSYNTSTLLSKLYGLSAECQFVIESPTMGFYIDFCILIAR